MTKHQLFRNLSTTAFIALSMHSMLSQAESIIESRVLKNTENAVFTADGRYFVAGTAGIHEIKPSQDMNPACYTDPLKSYSVCTVLAPEQNGDTCQYLGMTTDGTYLYATCAVYEGGLLSQLQPPVKAALVRILPGAQHDHQVKLTYLDHPTWYNGMAVLDEHTLLVSRSLTGSGPKLIGINIPGATIEKVTITDHTEFSFEISPCLEPSPDFIMPNGIQADGNDVYFVGGTNLYRIPVQADGSAGSPRKLYQTTINKTFDDFTLVGNQLAVTEIGILNGLGRNSITLINKRGSLVPKRITTEKVQLSSVVVDPGTFGKTGDFIGTSFFQGGIYRFSGE